MQRFFVDVSLNLSNSNYRYMTFGYDAKLFFPMQLIEHYPVRPKRLITHVPKGINGQIRQKAQTSRRRYEPCQRLKTS